MDEENKGSVQSLSSINFLAAIWLIISPWILTYTSGAKWNQLGFGIGILILAAVRFFAPRQQWASFLNGLAGVWLIIAPWILNYDKSAAYWNEVILGIIVAVLAFTNSAMFASHHSGHHHPA